MKKNLNLLALITRPKRKLKSSPYNLRKRKSKFLKSEEALTESIDFSVDDNEIKKIDRVANLIDSILNRSGIEKQEIVLDEKENIQIE